MRSLSYASLLYWWMLLSLNVLLFYHCSLPAADVAISVNDCGQSIGLLPADSLLLDSVDVLYGQDNKQPALDHFISSVAKKLPAHHPVLAYAIYRRGVLEYYQQEYQRAAQYYADAVSRYEGFGATQDAGTIAKLYRNISVCHYFVPGHLDSVYYFAERGIQFMQRCPQADIDDDIRIDLYQWAGLAARELGDLAAAAKLLEKGTEICRQGRGSYKKCAPTLMNYAWTLSDQGQPDTALSLSREAEAVLLAHQEELNAWDSAYLADIYNNRFEIFTIPAQAEAALATQHQSLKINRRIRPNGRELAGNYTNLGYIFTHSGRPDSALLYLHKAVEIFRQSGDSVRLAQNLENLADVAFAKGNYKRTLQHLDRARSIYYGIPVTHPITSALYKYEMILPMSRRAQTLYKLHQEDADSYQLESVLTAYEQVDSLVSALQYSVRSEASKILVVSRLKPVYEELIDICTRKWESSAEPMYLTKAFRYLERSKALVLRERRHRKNANLQRPFAQQERQLLANIDRLNRVLQSLPADATESSGLLDERHRYEILLNTYRDSLYRTTLPYESYLPATGTAFIDNVRRHMAPDQIGLDYFVGDSSVYVGVISNNALDMLRLEVKPDSLANWVRALRGALEAYGTGVGSPPLRRLQYDSVYRHTAYALYQNLIAPLSLSDKIGRLTIIPDGVLAYLPFSALLTEPSIASEDYRNYHYLIRNIAVNREFSLAIWNDNLQRPAGGGSGILAIAPTQSQSLTLDLPGHKPVYFSALRYNAEEISILAKQHNAEVLTGGRATLDNFIRLCAGFQVVHLTGHAFADPEYPYHSFLSFDLENAREPTEQILYLEQLEKIPLPVEMIVLSACSTADGELATGEGIISLSRAATLAGARSVMAGLWLVNQQSKSVLFQRFYNYLASGMTKDQALRQAQLEQLEHPMGYAHPYHWAGMINTGAARALELRTVK